VSRVVFHLVAFLISLSTASVQSTFTNVCATYCCCRLLPPLSTEHLVCGCKGCMPC
jgi:hypothetical protein